MSAAPSLTAPAGTLPASSWSPTISRCCRCHPVPPELIAVENVWQFLRDNWRGDRVFTSYKDVVDRCCEALNRLTNQP